MKRIKLKWLLGAMTVALTVAVFVVSVLAATPEYLNITSPTAAAWLARKSGASVTLSFDYASNPSVPPATTRALGRMCLVGADPTNPDLDTVIVEAWKDLTNGGSAGSPLSDSINLTIPASQAEGSYDARVVLTNSDGSPITDWEVGVIIVDNSAPNAPTNLTIAEDVNPGPDFHINDTTPTFTWTAATDNGNPASGIAKYWIQIDGKFTWREVAGTTYTVPGADALAEGTYSARVKAEDKAGNVGPETIISFTVDTTPPSVPPLDAEPAYTKGTSNTITWTAVGPGDYYAEYSSSGATDPNTGNFVTPLGNSGWILDTSWMVSGLTSGTTYYYHVKARDWAGNESDWSAAVSSTQDAVAPVFATSTYTPAAGSWSNVPSLTVSVKVTDALAGINTSAFVFTVDGNPPDAGTQAYDGVTGVLSGTFSGLTTGTHTVYVKAFDNADAGGNWAETTWTFGVDLEGPVISNTQPHGWITNSSPAVGADYSAGPSGLNTSVNTVTLRRSDYVDPGTPDTKKDGTWTATGDPDYLSGTLSYAPGALSDGRWNVGLDAKDRAGNTVSASWFFNIDTTPPAVPGLPSTTTPTNNTTPTWTWTASSDPAAPDGTAGSGLDHYEVKIGTTAGGDDILAPTNVGNVTTWTTDLDPSIAGNQGFTADGTYYISVRAVDAVGNASSWVGYATTKVVVDTVAPTLSGNTPTGYINTASPTLTVTFDDTIGTATVSGYDSTTAFTLDAVSVLPVSTEPASGDADGTITRTTSGLADGPHTVSITVQDKAGNSTTLGTVASPWTFFVDTQSPAPPTVTVTSPTNDTTPTFTFNGASDPAPSSGLASYTIEVWSGGAKVRGPYTAAYTADPFSWTVPDADALTPDGSYEIRVWSVDAAGNVSATYGSATVVIDTQEPVLANGAPTGYTADNTPTISADFTDVGEGLDTAKTALTLSRAGLTPINVTTGFTGTVYVDGSLSTTIEYTPSTGLADGLWTAGMVADDLAGNKSTPDPTLQWTFKIDTTSPTDPGNPVAGNLGDDGKWYINTLRPTFSWAASSDPAAPDGTPGSGLRDYTFQFGESTTKPASTVDTWAGALVDQSGITPTPSVSMQQWTPSTDLPLAAGVEYAGRVKAFDNLGNASAWANSVLIYDPDPPTAPGTPTTTSPTNDSTPVWRWAGSTDAISGVDLYHIQIRRAGSVDWDVLDIVLDIPDSLNPSEQTWEQGLQLQTGTYEIRVQAMDVAGNYSAWSGIGTVTVDVTPPAAPTMLPQSSYTNANSVSFIWSQVTGAVKYDFSYSLDGGSNWTTVPDLTVQTYTVDISALADGTVVKGKAVAYDAVGNVSAESNVVFTTVDRTGPVVSAVTTPSSPTNNPRPTWTWSGDDGSGSGVKGYWVTLDTEVPIWATGTSFTPSSNLGDGDHVVKVKGVDNLGNEGAEITFATVTVDTTPPGVPTNLAVPSPTKNNRPTWTWTASTGDVDRYEVSLDGAAAVNNGNVTSFTPPGALVDGQHNLKVRALDALGNASDWAGPAEVLVDTTAPVITLINPKDGARLNITTASTILADLFDSGSGIDQAKVRLKIDKGEWVAPTAIAGGTLYYVVNLPFEATDDKWHSLEIKARDVVGNEATVHACFKVELYRQGFGFGRLRFPEQEAEPND